MRFSKFWTTARPYLILDVAQAFQSRATLAERFSVTGVDISDSMIELARANVPVGKVYPSGYNVCRIRAFDRLTRRPRSILFSTYPEESIRSCSVAFYGWLKPGGYLLCLLRHHGEETYIDNFFGSTMYWSSYALEDYEHYLTDVGFRNTGRFSLPEAGSTNRSRLHRRATRLYWRESERPANEIRPLHTCPLAAEHRRRKAAVLRGRRSAAGRRPRFQQRMDSRAPLHAVRCRLLRTRHSELYRRTHRENTGSEPAFSSRHSTTRYAWPRMLPLWTP